MNARTTILNRNVYVAAVGTAILALPFSIKICHFGFIVFLILWLLEGHWNEKFDTIRKSTVLQLFLAFGIFLLIGIFYTENKTEGWLSLDKKIFLFTIPLALATSNVRFSKSEIRILLYLFVAACFIATLLCLANATFQALHHSETNAAFPVSYLNAPEFKRLHPTTGPYWIFFSYTALADGIGMHPAFFSLFILFCVIFLLQEFDDGNLGSKSHRRFAFILIIYFSLFIISLASRISILSLLCVYIFSVLKILRERSKNMNPYTIVILISVCLSMLFINPVSRYKNLNELFSTSLSVKENSFYQTATEIRFSLLWLGWKSFLKVNPLAGTGMGDVGDVMRSTSKEFSVYNVHQTYDPHNEFITLAIGSGITGLILFISCIGVPVLMAFSVRDYLTIGFVFLFVVLCLSEAVLERQKSIAFFSLFFPILAFHRQSFQLDNFRLKLFNARS